MILRYAVVGIIGTLTHVSLVVLLVELANISPTLSTALGFIVVLIISYFLNRFWTFEKQNDRHLIDFIKYTLVSLFGQRQQNPSKIIMIVTGLGGKPVMLPQTGVYLA